MAARRKHPELSLRARGPLLKIRLSLGYSQQKVAGLSGCTINMVRRIERLENLEELKLKTLVRIAAVLRCAVIDLIPNVLTTKRARLVIPEPRPGNRLGSISKQTQIPRV